MSDNPIYRVVGVLVDGTRVVLANVATEELAKVICRHIEDNDSYSEVLLEPFTGKWCSGEPNPGAH
jgi:hypothetical protein